MTIWYKPNLLLWHIVSESFTENAAAWAFLAKRGWNSLHSTLSLMVCHIISFTHLTVKTGEFVAIKK